MYGIPSIYTGEVCTLDPLSSFIIHLPPHTFIPATLTHPKSFLPLLL